MGYLTNAAIVFHTNQFSLSSLIEARVQLGPPSFLHTCLAVSQSTRSSGRKRKHESPNLRHSLDGQLPPCTMAGVGGAVVDGTVQNKN